MEMEVVFMKRRFYKPNMAALKGRTGKKIVEKLKNDMVISDDNIRKEALACKKRLMAQK